eukprot:TRINITY_DN23353_c0_g1_i1.p2 TRINITY_DN23353_c0_g1~~TRINITY_DN23353_c0_g1_i1.p2  ORF type:complete len:286 (+),score=66.47 TRINITY_DN23353_c0_g1_i1:93-860(+)
MAAEEEAPAAAGPDGSRADSSTLTRCSSDRPCFVTVVVHLLSPGGVTMRSKFRVAPTDSAADVCERVCGNVGPKLGRALQPCRVGLAVCDQAQREAGEPPPPLTGDFPHPDTGGGRQRGSSALVCTTTTELWAHGGRGMVDIPAAAGAAEERSGTRVRANTVRAPVKALFSKLLRRASDPPAGQAPPPEPTRRAAGLPERFRREVVFATCNELCSVPYARWCLEQGRELHFDLLLVSAPAIAQRRPFGKSLTVKT